MANGTEKYYDHMSLPGKGPVYFRDAKLREGRVFRVSGDLESQSVQFDGTDNVDLVTRLGQATVGLDNISPDAIAADSADSPEKLATLGPVIEASGAKHQNVVITATWRPRRERYVPDMTYEELRGFISRGFLPVLNVVRDDELIYQLVMISDDGAVAVFRTPSKDVTVESSLPDGTVTRHSMTLRQEFRYGPEGFTMTTEESLPAAYSVESIDI